MIIKKKNMEAGIKPKGKKSINSYIRGLHHDLGFGCSKEKTRILSVESISPAPVLYL